MVLAEEVNLAVVVEMVVIFFFIAPIMLFIFLNGDIFPLCLPLFGFFLFKRNDNMY